MKDETAPAPHQIDWNKVGSVVLDLLAVAGGAVFLARIAEPEHVQRASERMSARVDGTRMPVRSFVAQFVLETVRAANDANAPDGSQADAKDGGADEAAQKAAQLLGIRIDVSADDIRAALRAALRDTRLHPDHGGDGDAAKELIAAKNLLIERLSQENQS